MSSKITLVADQVIKGRLYPALAKHQARPYTPAWRQFGEHWPYTTPLRLQEYCNQHGVDLEVREVSLVQDRAWYPICIGFFDFSIDYFSLLPSAVRNLIDQRRLKLLFYYHEGDNPMQIKSRLDLLCEQNQLHNDCYVFISANTRAKKIPGFIWFADFELWYYQRNIEQLPTKAHLNPRSRDFTVLSRTHKSWRAAVMTDLLRNKLLDNSFWSYCETGDLTDDNPIEIDRIPQLRWNIDKFLQSAPYYTDSLQDHERNDHSVTVESHHRDSYANIVIESHMDVDQSRGSFLTEKTFKPIKHGQLFFVAGAAGSLQQLRDLGYRTFDSAIDTSYDGITDATERWIALRNSIEAAYSQGLAQIYRECFDDIQYNQELFMSQKTTRLNNLIERINEHN